MEDWETDSAAEDLPRGILQVQVYDDRLSSEGEQVIFSHDEAPSDDDDDDGDDGDDDDFDGIDAFDDMSDDSSSNDDQDSDLDTEHAADFDALIAQDRAAQEPAEESSEGRMPGSFPADQEGEGQAAEPEEDRIQCESSLFVARIRKSRVPRAEVGMRVSWSEASLLVATVAS